MPLLIASSRISGKPSKRELSTNIDASAMSAPMSSAGPSSVTRVAEPVLLDRPLELAPAGGRAPQIRSLQSGCVGRDLAQRRDQQVEALLAAEPARGEHGLGPEVGLGAAQGAHGVGDAAHRDAAVEQPLVGVAVLLGEHDERVERRVAALASPRRSALAVLAEVHVLQPDRAPARAPAARRRSGSARGGCRSRKPARPRRRRTSWTSVHSVKLDTARSTWVHEHARAACADAAAGAGRGRACGRGRRAPSPSRRREGAEERLVAAR